MYPAKDTHLGPKSPTLQDISNCLERLELLLSRFVQSSEVVLGSAVGGGGTDVGGQTQTRVHAHSGASIDETGTSNPNQPNQRPYKSTWELLWNNERVLHANTSSTETSSQNVSLDPFFELTQILQHLCAATAYNLVKLTRPPG